MGDVQLDYPADPVMPYRQTIPRDLLKNEVPPETLSGFFVDLARIDSYYKIYEKGAEFVPEGTKGDYVPSHLFYKKCRKLIDDEARFMFANTPDIQVAGTNTTDTQEMKDNLTVLNGFLSIVFKKNSFASKLIKAAKDCFIAGRVCVVANFNEKGIQIDFVNASEFYYELVGGELTRLIIFYHLNNTLARKDQRIQKKRYELENGLCAIYESVYDGSGAEVEKEVAIKTPLPYIPAYVILNDGLTGDTLGESEIDIIDDFESSYSWLANADKDTLRKSMNAIKYIIDGSKESTKDLGTGPGAIWDIQSDIEMQENGKASIGQLEPSMNYKDALKTTLDRIENNMFGMLSMPNITSEQLQGVITSGKTLRALYWPMVVRCSEKENVWVEAIEFLIDCVVDGGGLFPLSIVPYTEGPLPEIEYKSVVATNYALPDDEGEEKALDLQEVNSLAMSRKSYMMKWRQLTDEEADKELQQILFEKQLLEDSAFDTATFGAAAPGAGSEPEPAVDDEDGAMAFDEQGEENLGIEEEQQEEENAGEEGVDKE